MTGHTKTRPRADARRIGDSEGREKEIWQESPCSPRVAILCKNWCGTLFSCGVRAPIGGNMHLLAIRCRFYTQLGPHIIQNYAVSAILYGYAVPVVRRRTEYE